jgi:hypothetical protein
MVPRLLSALCLGREARLPHNGRIDATLTYMAHCVRVCVCVCVCVRALVAFQATELIKSGAIAANVTVGLVFTAYSGTSMEVSSLFDVGVP